MKNKTVVEEFRFDYFLERFSFNIDLLNYKLSRIEEIDVRDKDQQFEYLTIFDSTITQIRAMLLERGKRNYTFQNYFNEIGKPDIAQKLDEYLDNPFDAQNSRSIRTALKFISDKFICHLDEIDSIDLGNANYIMSVLSNPYVDTNLKEILTKLTAIISER